MADHPIKLTFLVGCYGDYPQYSVRCLKSIFKHTEIEYDLHVGCNACGEETTRWLQTRYNEGKISSLILLRQNINKCAMLRLLLTLADTEYFVWFDDDSHLIEDGWDHMICDLIAREHPDTAGHVFFCRRHEWNEEYEPFLRLRPWFAQRAFKDPENRVWFPTGGLWLARTHFLTYHGFPDPGMIRRADDVLFGELCEQHNGKISEFPNELKEKIRISDGDRRGTCLEVHDGWAG